MFAARKMLQKKETPVLTLALLLALYAAPQSLAASLHRGALFSLQTLAAAPFPPPSAVPQGTTVRISSTNSMAGVSQSLKQGFEQQFRGTTVNLQTAETAAALQAVLEGKTELAAIRRPLTAQEKSKGLAEAAVNREKIAIIVAANNPFKGDLTDRQFAQIFRGEVTNWSQLGGPAAPIRMVDRPEGSDTRLSFQAYPAFQVGRFANGNNVVRVATDTTDTVVQSLGSYGIGYAPLSQVANRRDVQVLTVYGSPPTDPKYPFSQPFSYVYKGPTPSAGVQAFLGYASAPAAQPLIAQGSANPGSAPAPATSPNPTATSTPAPTASPPTASPNAPSPSPPASPTATSSPNPAGVTTPGEEATAGTGTPRWLWLLLGFGILSVLLALLLGRRPEADVEEEAAADSEASETAQTTRPDIATLPPVEPVEKETSAVMNGAVPPAAPLSVTEVLDEEEPLYLTNLSDQSRIVLEPRDARHAYAYWEVPREYKEAIRQRGGQQLALRLYDVTGIDVRSQPPNDVQQFDCDEQANDWDLPVPKSDRDYVAELGYLTGNGRWLRLARSEMVRVPADPETESRTVPTVIPQPAVGGEEMNASHLEASGTATLPRDKFRLALVPRDSQQAYAYWDIPVEYRELIRQRGGQKLVLRLYDITGLDIRTQPPHSVKQFDCTEEPQEREVPILGADRDYIAEIGYIMANGRWLRLARSAAIHIASE
jgi:phosphate transport system substrate-binding protein